MSLELLTRTADWHAERALGIGGSDAAKIMSGDWFELWEQKTGRRAPEDLSHILQPMLGAYTEPFNAHWFTQETGIPVSTENCDHLIHPVHKFMRANLDGICPNAAFEAKHVSAFAKEDEIVTRYYPQCQHLMEVTGAELIYLSVIFGNQKWAYFDIPADAEYLEELVGREAEFWGYVEQDKPPPQQDAVVINIAFDDMREVDLTGNNQWASGAADWLEHRSAAKTFNDAVKSIKELVEPDVKLAHGHGIKATRAKNGAITLREMK